MSTIFDGKLGLQQRVLPSYRVPFFEGLAAACGGGMSLFAGSPRSSESIIEGSGVIGSKLTLTQNVHILRGSAYLCWQKGITSWLTGWDPDALVMEANPRYLSSRPAINWMKDRDRPIIGWGLGAPSDSGFLARSRTWIRNKFVKQFDAIIAYSTIGAEQYKLLGVPEDRVFVAHNAVSPRPAQKPHRALGQEANQRILYVGRLQARKRLDILIRACALLNKKPDLIIVGDGPEREALEALAAIEYPGTLFMGTLQGEDLSSQYLQADLFVLPGTGGLAVQEAMSYGLPVIVAEGDGTQNDLVSGGNGWLIPANNMEKLRETLDQALGDPRLLAEMGDRSFQLVRDRFNIEEMIKVFVEALGTVTNR